MRFNIRLAKALTTHCKKVYLLKLASPKLDTSHLSRDEEAVSRCEIALEQRDNETPQGALEIMRPLWRGVGTRPETQGLQPETVAYVFFCTGTLTGWIGARHQIKDAQESARDLITESITYYEAHHLKREAAEALSEIAYCYWREGQVNEARIMLLGGVGTIATGRTQKGASTSQTGRCRTLGGTTLRRAKTSH
jgi:hypothetical protein